MKNITNYDMQYFIFSQRRSEMDEKDNCDKCKKEFNWQDLIPSISEAECGNETIQCIPRSKEKKEFWDKVL